MHPNPNRKPAIFCQFRPPHLRFSMSEPPLLDAGPSTPASSLSSSSSPSSVASEIWCSRAEEFCPLAEPAFDPAATTMFYRTQAQQFNANKKMGRLGTDVGDAEEDVHIPFTHLDNGGAGKTGCGKAPPTTSRTSDKALISPVALSSQASAGRGASKLGKRRSRASSKPPITVLSADTSNFRAMVQKLTGIPSSASGLPPLFSSSYDGVHLHHNPKLWDPRFSSLLMKSPVPASSTFLPFYPPYPPPHFAFLNAGGKQPPSSSIDTGGPHSLKPLLLSTGFGYSTSSNTASAPAIFSSPSTSCYSNSTIEPTPTPPLSYADNVANTIDPIPTCPSIQHLWDSTDSTEKWAGVADSNFPGDLVADMHGITCSRADQRPHSQPQCGLSLDSALWKGGQHRNTLREHVMSLENLLMEEESFFPNKDY